MDRTDQNIVEQCLRKMQAGGDFREEYSKLVRRYSRFVFAIVLGHIKNYHKAEEVVQEVFLKAYNKLGTFNSKGNFNAWLARIAKNRSIDVLRRGGIQPLSIDQIMLDHKTIPAGLYHESSEAEINETRCRINTAILSLPEKLRSVAVMRFMESRSYRQIAVRLSLSETTVKSRLFRARKLLYEQLKPLIKQHAGGS